MMEIVNQLRTQDVEYDFEARKQRRKGKPLDIKIATENLILMKTVLDKHKIYFWLMWGTLLGALRENNFIEYDTDTDLGCFIKEKDGLINAIPDLIEKGLIPIRVKHNYGMISFMREDEYIDISIFNQERDVFFRSYWKQANNRIYGNHFEKFENFCFLDECFKIPFQSHRLLFEWYGEDWQIPQQNSRATGNPVFKKWYYPTYAKLLVLLRLLRKGIKT